MSDPSLANSLFTVLTLLANAFVVLALVAALVALVSASARQSLRGVLTKTAPFATRAAAAVAVVTTLGSLYYSQVIGWLPCELCWYQRICMFPLSAILVVGVIRRDKGVAWYALPFLVAGIPLALYHWLVERVPSLAEGSSCSAFVPCSIPYFQELGYITLAFMDMSAFILIAVLLIIGRYRGVKEESS